jgi:hypothetical protein
MNGWMDGWMGCMWRVWLGLSAILFFVFDPYFLGPPVFLVLFVARAHMHTTLASVPRQGMAFLRGIEEAIATMRFLWALCSCFVCALTYHC